MYTGLYTKRWKGSRFLGYRGMMKYTLQDEVHQSEGHGLRGVLGYKKRELIKIIGSLAEVNDTLIENLSGVNGDAIIKALTECQETAIAIGTELEKAGAEHTVHILEDYCEMVYQMTLVIDRPNKLKKLAKKIQKQLQMALNQVKYDLPDDKKEVIFLPYKASMWDSLESVWKAASEDETCEAYVIPIPYFDKNPDGSMGQMHYEGNDYPEDVPITDWQEYSIPERRPDAIYIHNPYDQFNYVTSVHPDYYASNLRKYTDLLVYIPYFIAIDDNVEKHFCTTNGVLYAHKVIVQSKKVRQTYIKELHKFEKENNCKGLFGKIEDKVVALGSPKYDKVLDAKREDYKIPREWEKVIVKPDGDRKKVILYNTTIGSTLKESADMLAKIEDVLKVFEKNQETALLWRPHPLLKATLKSMRPDLLKDFIRIEENYKEAGWGIYDESADLYRAIAISDAYYGDMSSVVELYKQTGKPIMIQNVEVIYQNADTGC